MTQVDSSVRLRFVDSTRGMALILAMVAHVTIQFTEWAGALTPFTRLATPAFVVLFGIMLEVAYLRKLRETDDTTRVTRHLIQRLVSCATLSAIIIIAAFIGGKDGVGATLKAVFFLKEGRFSDILKLYAFLFFFVIVTLPFLKRFGSLFLIGIVPYFWMLKYLLPELFNDNPYLVEFIFGSGYMIGPPVLPSVTYLAFGAAIGEYFTGRRTALPAVCILCVSAIFTVLEIDRFGNGFVFAWIHSRWYSAPLYYSLGIVATTFILALFAAFWRTPLLLPIASFFAVQGQETLFTYVFGNAVLNLLPTYHGGPMISFCLALGFLCVLFMLAHIKARHSEVFERLFLGLPSHCERVYANLMRQMSQWIYTLGSMGTRTVVEAFERGRP